jgi:hypothetical protein
MCAIADAYACMYARARVCVCVCACMLLSAAAVVIEESGEREKRKKLFHQKWHRATVAVMSCAALLLVHIDRTHVRLTIEIKCRV